MKVGFYYENCFLNRAPKYPWECSTAKFCEQYLGLKLKAYQREQYLGLKLKAYQRLMINTMDFRDNFDKRFRPLAHYQRALQRGRSARFLVCDEDYLKGHRMTR